MSSQKFKEVILLLSGPCLAGGAIVLDKMNYPTWAIVTISFVSALGFATAVGLVGILLFRWRNNLRYEPKAPLLILRDDAKKRHWNFDTGLNILDFVAALRQAGVEGRLIFWGREDTGTNALTINNPLVKIDPSHWHEFMVEYSSLRGAKNFEVHTRTLLHAVRYKDIHVGGENVYGWLAEDAEKFKGFVRNIGQNL